MDLEQFPLMISALLSPAMSRKPCALVLLACGWERLFSSICAHCSSAGKKGEKGNARCSLPHHLCLVAFANSALQVRSAGSPSLSPSWLPPLLPICSSGLMPAHKLVRHLPSGIRCRATRGINRSAAVRRNPAVFGTEALAPAHLKKHLGTTCQQCLPAVMVAREVGFHGGRTPWVGFLPSVPLSSWIVWSELGAIPSSL